MLVFTWSGYVALPKKEWLNLSLWFYQMSWVYCKRLPVEFRDMACDHSSVITEMGRQACEFSGSFENSVPESWKKKKKKKRIILILNFTKNEEKTGGRGEGEGGQRPCDEPHILFYWNLLSFSICRFHFRMIGSGFTE